MVVGRLTGQPPSLNRWPGGSRRRARLSRQELPRRRAATWTEGAVILGRRGAPVCSGGGRFGADGE